MELIGRAIVIALCVLAAHALPSLTDVNVDQKIGFLSQFQRAAVAATVVPPSAANNSQESCTSKFSTDVMKINNQTVIQASACYKSADEALKEYDDKVLNKTVREVNALSKNLQMTLANCSAKTANVDILVCYLQTFDTNMANLNNISSLSQLAASSVNDVEYSAEIEAKICVNQVLMSSKVNSSIAANDLQSCLSNTTVVAGRNGSLKSGLRTKAYYVN